MRVSVPAYCTIQAATFRQVGALAVISAVMPWAEVLKSANSPRPCGGMDQPAGLVHHLAVAYPDQADRACRAGLAAGCLEVDGREV
jgi:hypothetical protein